MGLIFRGNTRQEAPEIEPNRKRLFQPDLDDPRLNRLRPGFQTADLQPEDVAQMQRNAAPEGFDNFAPDLDEQNKQPMVEAINEQFTKYLGEDKVKDPTFQQKLVSVSAKGLQNIVQGIGHVGTIARLKGEEIREGDFFNFSNELTKNLEKKVTKDMPPEEQLIFDLQKADLRQKTDQMPDSLVTKFLDGSQKVSTDVAGGALEIVGKSLKASTDWVNNRAGFNEEILAELDNLRTPEGKIDLEKITDPWRIAQAISGGIGSMIPAAAAFGVTGNPLSFGVVMFTQEKVDAYETYSQELAKTKEIAIEDLTKEDLQKIDEYSDYYGVLSAALETAAPMTIGGRILGKQAAKGAVKSFLLQVPKEVLRGVVLEGSTEAMQRFSQNLIAKESGINPDQDLYDGVFEEGYAGAATGGFFGTFAGVSQANKARIEASQKQQSKMNTILDESFDQTEKQFEGIDLKTGQPKEVKVSGADPVDTRPLNKDLVQGRIDDVAQKIERNFGKEPTIVYKPTSFVTVEVSNSIAQNTKTTRGSYIWRVS